MFDVRNLRASLGVQMLQDTRDIPFEKTGGGYVGDFPARRCCRGETRRRALCGRLGDYIQSAIFLIRIIGLVAQQPCGQPKASVNDSLNAASAHWLSLPVLVHRGALPYRLLWQAGARLRPRGYRPTLAGLGLDGIVLSLGHPSSSGSSHGPKARAYSRARSIRRRLLAVDPSPGEPSHDRQHWLQAGHHKPPVREMNFCSDGC